MAKEPDLIPVNEHGWRCGLTNLLRLENQRWWSTSRWWVLGLIMLGLLNGLLAFGLWIDPLIENVDRPPEFLSGTLDVFFMWMSIITVITTIFVVQGAIIGEKQSGVAAWILSAPVSRSAYIFAKFIGNAFALIMISVFFQGLVAYTQLSLIEKNILPFTPILTALALQSLYLLFYLSLVILLGVLFSSRVAVLAISFGILIGQPFIDSSAEDIAPWISWALPAKLPELARFAHRWESFPSFSSIFVTIALTIGFLLIAIWRFKRCEF